MLNTRLEDILYSHKDELYTIYQNSNKYHNASPMFTEKYTPSLTK